MKTIKFITLGCKVNQYETQAIREGFLNYGFKETVFDKADLFVINSCIVTGQAQGQSEGFIRRIRRNNPASKIVFTGCGAHQKVQNADFIIPNALKHKIPEIVLRMKAETTSKKSQIFCPLNISGFYKHDRAFLKIQDGCNNFCAYCILPLVRGKSRSRPLPEIIQEAGRLIRNGFKEIVLTGICLGAYGADFRRKNRVDLVNVIEALEEIEGDFRIRLSSIEAKDVSNRLIQKLNRSQKLCPHLHIPFQSGDDEILKYMNRHYRVKDYLELVKRLRNVMPKIAITTDIMAGFPGETEKNFKNTILFLEDARPSRIHIFPFSPRPNTKAANLKNLVAQGLIRQRLKILKSKALELSLSYRRQFLNQSLAVLVESIKDKRTGLFCGYSQNYIKVNFCDAHEFAGRILKVKIKRVDNNLTFGEAVR